METFYLIILLRCHMKGGWKGFENGPSMRWKGTSNENENEVTLGFGFGFGLGWERYWRHNIHSWWRWRDRWIDKREEWFVSEGPWVDRDEDENWDGKRHNISSSYDLFVTEIHIPFLLHVCQSINMPPFEFSLTFFLRYSFLFSSSPTFCIFFPLYLSPSLSLHLPISLLFPSLPLPLFPSLSLPLSLSIYPSFPLFLFLFLFPSLSLSLSLSFSSSSYSPLFLFLFLPFRCQDYIILCVEDTTDWKHATTRYENTTRNKVAMVTAHR